MVLLLNFNRIEANKLDFKVGSRCLMKSRVKGLVTDDLIGGDEVRIRWMHQNMRLRRIIDIQPVLAQHADLEGDLLNLLQRLAAKQPHGIQQIEDRIHARPPGLELSGRNPRSPSLARTRSSSVPPSPTPS